MRLIERHKRTRRCDEDVLALFRNSNPSDNIIFHKLVFFANNFQTRVILFLPVCLSSFLLLRVFRNLVECPEIFVGVHVPQVAS